MADVKRISPQEANGLMVEGWTYVDVRTVEEFEAGHPAGAVNVPLMLMAGGGMSANPAFASAMKASFPREAKIIVGCKAGGRSLKAAHLLVGEGFLNVVDQRAGWDGARNPFGQMSDPGWSRVGLPVEEGQPAGRSWADVKAKTG